MKLHDSFLIARVTALGIVVAVAALLMLALVSCGPNSKKTAKKPIQTQKRKFTDKPFFQNVAESAGINHVYENGEEVGHYAILESIGGGGAVLDYDRDGRLDLFLTGGGGFAGKDKKQITGKPCRLYKNLGGWKFRDVTEETGLNVAYPYTHGVAVGDYNRDGRPDLLIAGYGKLMLFENSTDAGGAVKFIDVTEKSGLALHCDWPVSAAFADFDGDGFCDLYVCQYLNWSFQNHPKCPSKKAGKKHDICSPVKFQSHPDFLFRNNGKGRFVNVSKQAGLRLQRPKDDPHGVYLGHGLAVLTVDINDDQKPDVYVANDMVDNFLYVNESKAGEIRFKEIGLSMNVARDDNGVSNASMGLDAADIDETGLASLFCTNYENELHAMYRMILIGGTRRYVYNTQLCGIAQIGNKYVGWGTAFIDLENNGWQDLVIANGHVYRHPENGNLRQKAILFRNAGKGKFKPITELGGDYFAAVHRGRGLIAADLDDNGFEDFVVSHVNEPVAVVKNICESKNHWLGVRLAVKDHADVIGAKLTLQVGERKLTRFQKAGGSYASSNDPRILFGLGASKSSGTLTVHWPSGQPRVESWRELPLDQYHRLVQGTGKKK